MTEGEEHSMYGQTIFAVILGIVLHQTEPIILSLNTDSEMVRLLSRYGVGVIGTAPAFDLFMKMMGLDKKARLSALVAYFLGFIFVGIGVFLGRVPRNINGTTQH